MRLFGSSSSRSDWTKEELRSPLSHLSRFFFHFGRNAYTYLGGSSSMYFRWRTVLIDTIGISAIGEAKFREGRKSSSRVAARLVSWVKIDGHQCPWAASRLEQGIAPPRRPRSGGATAAPQIPTLRRRRPSGRTVIRTCRRYPCEAVPHYFVIVPRGVFRGTSSLFLSIHARKFLDMHVSLHKLPLFSSDSPCFHLFFVHM